MTSYEREWFVYPEDAEELPPRSRLHVGLTARGGRPRRFLVQLEYWDGERWLQVARFDHGSGGPTYRDVERSGLHLDVYEPAGGQRENITRWPPEASRSAMARAGRYLRRNAEYFVRRFESWL